MNNHYVFACPHCRKEIRYNRDYYDREISKLKSEITTIQSQFQNHEYCKANPDWYRKAVKALEIKIAQLSELKKFRNAANHHIEEERDSIFRRLVKEKLGEKEYVRLWEEASEELTCENISETMKHEYSRKGGKNVSSLW